MVIILHHIYINSLHCSAGMNMMLYLSNQYDSHWTSSSFNTISSSISPCASSPDSCLAVSMVTSQSSHCVSHPQPFPCCPLSWHPLSTSLIQWAALYSILKICSPTEYLSLGKLCWHTRKIYPPQSRIPKYRNSPYYTSLQGTHRQLK